jgi:hypothetical protein
VALILCPECHRSISDQAPTCPGCGYPINRNNDPAVSYLEERRQAKQTAAIIGSVMLLVAFIIILLASIHVQRSVPTFCTSGNLMGTPIGSASSCP